MATNHDITLFEFVKPISVSSSEATLFEFVRFYKDLGSNTTLLEYVVPIVLDTTTATLLEFVQLERTKSSSTTLLEYVSNADANPGRRRVWDGTKWVSPPEYVWNGTSWVSVVPANLTLPLTVPWTSNGYNGLMRNLGWMIAQQVNSGQLYVNPAKNTPSNAPWYPVGGYPGGAVGATTSMSNVSGASDSYRAFDNNTTVDGAVTTGGDVVGLNVAGNWWASDFGTHKVTLTRFGIQARNDTYAPRNFKIQGSNDGSVWDDLYTATAEGPTQNAWWSCQITSTTAYKHIRILQTGLNSNGSNWLVLGDVEMWGTIA